MASIELVGTPVGNNFKAYVVAEIGSNHGGDLAVAKQLIQMAKTAGADACKFQKRDNRELFTKAFYNSPYGGENALAPTYGTHREALEFDFSDFLKLSDYANDVGITFVATPFDFKSADFLNSIDVPFFKVASGSMSNLPLVRRLAEFGKPVLISTGGWPLWLVKQAVETALAVNDDVVVLHCTAEYPLKIEHANLGRITTLKEMFPNLVIGFSDHQGGISLGPVAYALGARVFEKHITYDHSARGTDHSFSLEFYGLTQYIRYLGHARAGMGFVEQPFDEEKEPIRKMSQACYFNRDMFAVEVVRAEDLVLKSPGDGIQASDLPLLVGRRLSRDVAKEEALDWSDFAGEY